MSRAELAAALELAGLPPEAVAARVSLFEECATWRSQRGWKPADHAWWIPGRLEVFGKHTDYAGGRTLVTALPRGMALLASRPRASDAQVTIVDARNGETVTMPAADPLRHTGWADYVEAVVRRLARNFPGAELAADLVFASDLPPAAGMSSSSALIVGLAAALVRLGDLESRAEWRRNISGPLDAAAYYACIENGATFGTLDGDAGVGTYGGSEDHAAILCAAPAQLTAYAFVPLRLVARIAVPAQWRFVVASSGVRAEKAGAAREVYNGLARDASALLQLWNAHEPVAASLAAALTTGAAAPERLVQIIRSSRASESAADALERRLAHFLREDRRVPDALAACSSADAAALGALASDSQHDAEVLLRNQVPETIALAAAARALGAIAACSFGAGFGGSVWALVEREAARTFPTRWLAACRRACPPGAVAFEAAPGPPLTELTPRAGL
jgi:galactokinase